MRVAASATVGILVLLYFLGFAFESMTGGYSLSPERSYSKFGLWGNGGITPRYCMVWKYRNAKYDPDERNILGYFYAPLIYFDRKYLNQTKYAIDPDFHTWLESLSPEDLFK